MYKRQLQEWRGAAAVTRPRQKTGAAGKNPRDERPPVSGCSPEGVAGSAAGRSPRVGPGCAVWESDIHPTLPLA